MRTPLLTVAATLAIPALLYAHPAPFSYIDVRIGDRELSGTLVVHTIDAAHELKLPSEAGLGDAALVARNARALEAILAARMVLLADGGRIQWSMTGARPLVQRDAIEIAWTAPIARIPGRLTISGWLFPYDPNHETYLNVYERESLVRQEVLDSGRTRVDFFTGTPQGKLAVLTSFVGSGIHHIAIGPDHLLFIIGLLLLGGSIPRLLAIVTAFTAGHSLTLALATLGIVQPPARIVEPAIALSIVFVGADNLLAGSRGRDVRPWVALAFGLVHGFGFASVLRETGLPDGALGLSLFSFNLGVEIGQATVVVAIASALAVIRRWNAVAAQRLATAGSVIVMLAGALWFVQRVK
jgi:hydrogenase/urease accessory protein HupE